MHDGPVKAFSEKEIAQFAATLPLWAYDPNRRALYRKIEFDSFSEAIGAMMRIAIAAERTCHHPEWFNVYNQLEIWLTTHDAGGVSERDIALAARIDHIADM